MMYSKSKSKSGSVSMKKKGKTGKTAKSHGSTPKSTGPAGGVKHMVTSGASTGATAPLQKHRKGM